MPTLNRKQVTRYVLLGVVVLIALFVVLHLWNYYTQAPWTRDGRIRGDVMRISSDVSGLVNQVMVQDNQSVKQGQVLFSIDASRFEIAVAQARANLEKARANLANASQQRLSAQANIALSEAGLADARAQADKARKDLQRIDLLKNDNAVSLQEQDRYRTVNSQALANLEKQHASIEVAKQNLNAVDVNKSALLADVANAEAALTLAELNLKRTQVIAPSDGNLSNFDLKAGNYVSAGQPVAALLNRQQLYVVGYFEETKLERIHVNDRVSITLMGDSRKITGHVQGIATGIDDRERSASGSMLANINPTFNWVRLAQRVPVRITLDKVPDPNMLVAGRTVTVHILEKKADDNKPAH